MENYNIAELDTCFGYTIVPEGDQFALLYFNDEGTKIVKKELYELHDEALAVACVWLNSLPD